MLEFYESHVVDDEALAHGIANGTLAVDTRLRDALRLLRSGQSSNVPILGDHVSAERLLFTDDAVDEEYLSEFGMLEDADPRVLAQRKADDLEARLAAVERPHSSRILKAVSLRRPGFAGKTSNRRSR
jgi:hypothetical protein